MNDTDKLVEQIEVWELDYRYGEPRREALDIRAGRGRWVIHLDAPCLQAPERISILIAGLAPQLPELSADLLAFDHALLMAPDEALKLTAQLIGKLRTLEAARDLPANRPTPRPDKPVRGRRPADESVGSALIVKQKHPEWSDARIAKEVGCSGGTLSKSKLWRSGRNTVGRGGVIRHGSKDDGTIEALDG